MITNYLTETEALNYSLLGFSFLGYSFDGLHTQPLKRKKRLSKWDGPSLKHKIQLLKYIYIHTEG